MPRRRLALLPASFFIIATIVNARHGTLHDLVWVCNSMNVALAFSLAAGWLRGVWISTLWLIIGSPLWLLDAIRTHDLLPHSFLTHFAGTAVGIYALIRTPRPRHLWWQAVLTGIGLQLLSRALTPPEYNINIAYSLYEPLVPVLPRLAGSFALAEVANILAFCITMLILVPVLGRVIKSY